MKRACLSLIAVVAAVGCAERPTAVTERTVTAMASLEGIGAQGDYVVTPAGWFHRSCVHEIPNGARVSSGVVTLSDGSTYAIPTCLYPAYPTWRPPSGPEISALPFLPTDTGWVEFAWTNPQTMYGELYARWAVPAVPTGSYSGYDVYYAFPGLRTYAFINQPVIQYGYNGIVGGNFWGMATWHCDGGNYTCLHSTLDTVYAGDSIAGRVQTRFDCPHSPCHWYLQMSDLTRDTWTGFDYDDSQADTVDYYEAVGGAVEVKNLTSCNQYPSTGVFFNSISLYDASGNKQSHVNWQKTIDSTAISPICGFGVTFTDSTVNLYHNPPPPPPPFSVTINGQSLVPARHQCTWYAMPANGTAPYTYSWTVNGTAAGNGSDSLTITTPTRAFTIGVQATDANNNQASNTLPVSIGGSSCES